MAGLVKYTKIDPKATRGVEAGLGDAIGAGFESARLQGVMAETGRHAEVYGGWRPVFDSVIQGYLDLPEDLGKTLAEQGFAPDDATLDRLTDWVGAEGQKHGISLTPDMATLEVSKRRDEVYTRDREAVERENEILSRAGRKTGIAGSLIGGVGAEFLDPLNLATLPAGAPARAGLLVKMLAEGGVNAAIEAASTDVRNRIASDLGQDETSMIENAAIGALFGAGATAGFAAIGKGVTVGARELKRVGGMISERRRLAKIASQSDDPEIRTLGETVARDMEDLERAVMSGDAGEVREAGQRAQAAAEAAHTGQDMPIADRPTFESAQASIINGQIEEVSPRDLAVQPDVFQFKSDTVAPGGVTKKLQGVTTWHPERAGVAVVYEYADGSRAIADGHQRVALASRLNAEGGDIRLAARVYREADGFTVDDVRVLAALKNISEAADGMTSAMSRDAAKVLRIKPEAIAELPSGPGIVRAKALAKLSDDAFDMFINAVIPERFAELVGRMVDDPNLHAPMMTLLKRAGPETTEQAEAVLSQAMASPLKVDKTVDLFGETDVIESLYLERAKVMERALKILRQDQGIFRVLDDQSARIEGAGRNRLDERSNREMRQKTEEALASIKALAYRAGPISEALNNGAQNYKETGKLAEAAEAVAGVVRTTVERDGLAGARAGGAGRAAKPPSTGGAAPDALKGFDDPVEGEGPKAQIANTRLDALEGNSVIAIRRKSGEVIGEFFDSDALPDFDQSKVALVRSGSYLARVNSLSQSMDGTPEARAAIAKEFGADPVINPDTRVAAEAGLFDEVPVGRGFDDQGQEVALTKTRQELAEELDAEDDAVEVLSLCMRG